MSASSRYPMGSPWWMNNQDGARLPEISRSSADSAQTYHQLLMYKAAVESRMEASLRREAQEIQGVPVASAEEWGFDRSMEEEEAFTGSHHHPNATTTTTTTSLSYTPGRSQGSRPRSQPYSHTGQRPVRSMPPSRGYGSPSARPQTVSWARYASPMLGHGQRGGHGGWVPRSAEPLHSAYPGHSRPHTHGGGSGPRAVSAYARSPGHAGGGRRRRPASQQRVRTPGVPLHVYQAKAALFRRKKARLAQLYAQEEEKRQRQERAQERRRKARLHAQWESVQQRQQEGWALYEERVAQADAYRKANERKARVMARKARERDAKRREEMRKPVPVKVRYRPKLGVKTLGPTLPWFVHEERDARESKNNEASSGKAGAKRRVFKMRTPTARPPPQKILIGAEIAEVAERAARQKRAARYKAKGMSPPPRKIDVERLHRPYAHRPRTSRDSTVPVYLLEGGWDLMKEEENAKGGSSDGDKSRTSDSVGDKPSDSDGDKPSDSDGDRMPSDSDSDSGSGSGSGSDAQTLSQVVQVPTPASSQRPEEGPDAHMQSRGLPNFVPPSSAEMVTMSALEAKGGDGSGEGLGGVDRLEGTDGTEGAQDESDGDNEDGVDGYEDTAVSSSGSPDTATASDPTADAAAVDASGGSDADGDGGEEGGGEQAESSPAADPVGDSSAAADSVSGGVDGGADEDNSVIEGGGGEAAADGDAVTNDSEGVPSDTASEDQPGDPGASDQASISGADGTSETSGAAAEPSEGEAGVSGPDTQPSVSESTGESDGVVTGSSESSGDDGDGNIVDEAVGSGGSAEVDGDAGVAEVDGDADAGVDVGAGVDDTGAGADADGTGDLAASTDVADGDAGADGDGDGDAGADGRVEVVDLARLDLDQDLGLDGDLSPGADTQADADTGDQAGDSNLDSERVEVVDLAALAADEAGDVDLDAGVDDVLDGLGDDLESVSGVGEGFEAGRSSPQRISTEAAAGDEDVTTASGALSPGSEYLSDFDF